MTTPHTPSSYTLWKTSDISPTAIEPVTCFRESDSHVWLETVRDGRFGGIPGPTLERKRRTSWEQYHGSWEAARQYLVEAARDRVEAARRSVAEHERTAQTLLALKAPAVQACV